MNNLKKYIDETCAKYTYRLKFAFEVSETALNDIIYIVDKYEILDMTKPIVTAIQCNPVDFPKCRNVPITIIDVITHVPVSQYMLHQQLRAKLNVPYDYVAVRCENEPSEIELAKLYTTAEIIADAEKYNYDPGPLMSTDVNYIEMDNTPSDLYGDAYNNKLLAYLATVSADRVENITDGRAALFSWLKPNEDDFNADFDTVKAVPWWKAKKVDADITNHSTRNYGNLDDVQNTVTKVFKDSEGNRKTISKKLKGY